MGSKLVKLELEVVPLRREISSVFFAEDIAGAYHAYLRKHGCLAELAKAEKDTTVPESFRLRIHGPETVVARFARAEVAVVHRSWGRHPYAYDETGRQHVAALTRSSLPQVDDNRPDKYRLYAFDVDQIEQVIHYRRRRVRSIRSALRYGRIQLFLSNAP